VCVYVRVKRTFTKGRKGLLFVGIEERENIEGAGLAKRTAFWLPLCVCIYYVYVCVYAYVNTYVEDKAIQRQRSRERAQEKEIERAYKKRHKVKIFTNRHTYHIQSHTHVHTHTDKHTPPKHCNIIPVIPEGS